jgi:hypothetical protein
MGRSMWLDAAGERSRKRQVKEQQAQAARDMERVDATTPWPKVVRAIDARAQRQMRDNEERIADWNHDPLDELGDV